MPRKRLGPQPKTQAAKMTVSKNPELEEPVLVREGVWLSKVMGEWLPLPAQVLRQLDWTEGTELELLSITNGQVIIRKKDALKDA